MDWIGLEGLGHSLSSLLSYSLVTIDAMLNSWQYFWIGFTSFLRKSRDLLRRLGALRKCLRVMVILYLNGPSNNLMIFIDSRM